MRSWILKIALLSLIVPAFLTCGAQAPKLIVPGNASCDDATERRLVLEQEAAKLTNEYSIAQIKPFGRETELSRLCYERLNRYVRYAEKGMRDWPAEPGAKFHKIDHSQEHAVRQNANIAFAFATLSRLGDYKAAVAGIPRGQVKAEAIAVLRYLAVTHAANFVPTGDGKKWGDHWQSAHWASSLAFAAWLLWDDLPQDVKIMAARAIVHEADRFNERPPDNGEWLDTKAEENAWNSQIIAIAPCMFPRHPHAALWRERAIVYMINSFSIARDHQDNSIVDGRPVKDRVTTTCVHWDFTLDNHNRMHPDYLSAVTLNLQNALAYRMAGMPIPQSTFHHLREVSKSFQAFTSTNASTFYPNGQDWWPHRHDTPLLVGGLSGALLKDPSATYLERAGLQFMGQLHSRFDNGTLFDRREYNYPNVEEEMMRHYAELYLYHRLFGDGPKPVSARKFESAQTGARLYEAGGFVTHRTPDKYASFAWTNNIMGLIYPGGDTWFTSPDEWGLVGHIAIAEGADNMPQVCQKNVTLLNLDHKADGMAFVGKLLRCQGKVEQRLAMISLPEAPVFYVEQIIARTNVTVKEIATASIAILNEEANPIAGNRRALWTAQGETVVCGAMAAPHQAAEDYLWDTPWANIDDRLGIVAEASGRMDYRAPHQYRNSRLQQILAANFLRDVGARKSGDIISQAIVEFIPNARHSDTRRTWRAERLGDGAVAVSLGKRLLVVNLGDDAVQGQVFGRVIKIAPLSAQVCHRGHE